MIIGQEKLSLEDALAHHGVMGMKWGVRRNRGGSGGGSEKGPSKSRQIKDARKVVEGRVNEINRNTDKLNIATSSGASEKKIRAIAQDHQKLVAAYDKDPHRAMAVRMTTGEKVASVLLTGPFAAIPIGGSALISRQIAKNQAKNK